MANVPMTTTQFRDAYTPVLIDLYQTSERQLAPQWKEFIKVTRSRKLGIENQVMNYGLGVAQLKPEGTPIMNQGGGEAFKATWIKQTWAIGFAVTEEAMEFNEFLDIQDEYGRELPIAQNETLEIAAADMLNNAFSSSYTGGDGVSLVNTAHPITPGTYSNQLATAADLSEAAIEAIAIQVANAVDQTGRPAQLEIEQLLIPNNYMFTAERILKSYLQYNTANNSINALREKGTIPKIQLVRRLVSQKQWFVQTSAKNGLQLKYGWKPKVAYEGDFPTGNMRGKSTVNWGMAWLNPRDIFGTPGVGS